MEPYKQTDIRQETLLKHHIYNNMRTIKDYLILILKGAGMGAADVVPGVSGGTIAFMTGIFEELVNSINSLNSTALRLLAKGQMKEFWGYINGTFLVSVFAGILLSIVTLARLMQFLLTDYPIETWSFFFGLIVASSIAIMRNIKGWNLVAVVFMLIGVALGVMVCTLSPTETTNDMWFIFLSGALAICAMILPGISGSFILLILGKYEYIMSTISGLTSGEVAQNLPIICTFGAGAVCGIVAFTKFLHWLLKSYHKQTLLIMDGFIIGSLVKIWPWNNMEAIKASQFPDVAEEALKFIPASEVSMHYPTALLFVVVGFIVVMAAEMASRK